MSKSKLIITLSVAGVAVLVGVSALVFVLHDKKAKEEPAQENVPVMAVQPSTEETMPVIEFSQKLSDYVGRVVVSHDLAEEDLNSAMNCVLKEVSDDVAVYVWMVSIDREVGPMLNYTVSNKSMDIFYDKTVPMETNEDTTWKTLLGDKVIYEEADNRINMMQ